MKDMNYYLRFMYFAKKKIFIYIFIHFIKKNSYPFGSIRSSDKLLTNSLADSRRGRGLFLFCICQVGSSIFT